jgi:mannose-6-phosphate isomerase-like protein (cupin superfamily)
MSKINERLDSLKLEIQKPEFLEGKGLSNEVNIRIFCYDAADEMIVRHFTEQLIVDQSLDCHLIERNLYKVFLSICDDKRITDKASQMEEKKGKDFLFKNLQKFANNKSFVEKMQYEPHEPGDVLLLTGVGEVFPFMRIHSLLEALQPEFPDIPILVMGAKDMIVAASGDGILVADKDRSGAMKPLVEKIVTDVRYAEKSWGSMTVVDAGPASVTMKVVMKPGTRMSYHSHELRNEIWTVLSGRGRTIVDDMEQEVGPGDVVSVAAGCRHTVLAETELVLLEIQIGSEISAGDKKKYALDGVPGIDEAADKWSE